MRRRIQALAAIAVACLAFSGCSSGSDQAATTTPTRTPTPTSASPTPTASPTSTPLTTASPTATRPAPQPVVKAKPKPVVKPKPTIKPKPKPAPQPPKRDFLNGGAVTTGPVVVAKIDNTAGGRPQYGVSQADVVYIEQVEGGLTRMAAVFHSSLPTEVGPIRSVRSTDSQLLAQFGTPILAFSGGAGGPLDRLHATRVIDGSAVGAYWRSAAAPPPYNLHVNLQQVVAALKGGSPKFSGFTFAYHDARLPQARKVTQIDVVMQAGTTNFRYDFTRQSYRVYQGGSPASDASGAALRAQNVLVQNVIDEPDGTVDSIGSPSYLSKTVGRGTFTLYRDGHAVSGTWNRTIDVKGTRFYDRKGKEVTFKPGKTWVLLAPQTSQVSDR